MKTFLLLCLMGSGGVDAFAPNASSKLSAAAVSSKQRLDSSSSTALNVNIPRVNVPDSVSDTLSNFDLKNPNNLNDAEYRGFAGATIAGTLVFFLLPGAVISGLYDEIGDTLVAIVLDFIVSTLLGGSLSIYLSLRSDQIGEIVREYVCKAMSFIGIGSFQITLPSVITGILTSNLGLMDPNTLNEKEFTGFSGAAVLGTLAFFLLPGAFLTEGDVLEEFARAAIVDTIFSTILGGGLTLFLALRKDGVGSAVSDIGAKILDLVDGDGNNGGDDSGQKMLDAE